MKKAENPCSKGEQFVGIARGMWSHVARQFIWLVGEEVGLIAIRFDKISAHTFRDLDRVQTKQIYWLDLGQSYLTKGYISNRQFYIPSSTT